MQTSSRVTRAVILAAGNGDRFHSGSRRSKLLTPVLGTPLILRTLGAVARAGIVLVDIVIGYDGEAVRSIVEAAAPPDIELRFHPNRHWEQENGVSALVASPHVGADRFALVMGDHIFESRALRTLTATGVGAGESLMAIEAGPVSAERAAEATRVRLDRDRIVAIGKDLEPFDALDTGLFVFDPSVFGAIEESCAAGDTSLSGGVRRLASQGLMRGVDTGGGWQDIDTIADLAPAEAILRKRPRTQ